MFVYVVVCGCRCVCLFLFVIDAVVVWVCRCCCLWLGGCRVCLLVVLRVVASVSVDACVGAVCFNCWYVCLLMLFVSDDVCVCRCLCLLLVVCGADGVCVVCVCC